MTKHADTCVYRGQPDLCGTARELMKLGDVPPRATGVVYDLCTSCLGQLPSFDHLEPGDSITLVDVDACPRCASETVTLTPQGKAAARRQRGAA